MKLEIEILFKDCIYLEDISYHNNSKYKLPFYTNECNILNKIYDNSKSFKGDSIGIIVDGEYKPKYWLHVPFDKKQKKYILYRFRNNQ